MNYEIVDQAIADGKLWRAKEILQGRLASQYFDTELLRRYGEVLLAMGDLIEAGRMLFCSGARNPEFAEAIGLFLSRNDRSDPRRFLNALPLMLRRQSQLIGFVVSEEFELGGWSEGALDQIRQTRSKVPRKPQSRFERLKERVTNAFGIGVLIFFVLSMMIGMITIFRYVWSQIFS